MKRKTYALLRKLKKPSCIVLGINTITGLSIVRCLGTKGVPVIAVDKSKFVLGAFSKFCSAVETCSSDEELFSFLDEAGRISKYKNLIICESDTFLLFVDKYKEDLKRYFYLPAEFSLSELMNKINMVRLAKGANLDVPFTFFSDEILTDKIKKDLPYPCFIKPNYTQTSQKTKGEIIRNAQELDLTLRNERFKNGYMIQEIIDGPETNLWLYMGYIDKKGELKASFALYKIRQVPMSFGAITSGVSRRNVELEKLGRRFLEHIQYTGIFSVEFKKDIYDGKYKFIEINPRICTPNELLVTCGINLPYLAYCDANNIEINPIFKWKENVQWLSIIHDFITCFKYYSKNNKRIFLEWLKLSVRAQSEAIFKFSDLPPFLFAVFYHFFRLVNKKQ